MARVTRRTHRHRARAGRSARWGLAISLAATTFVASYGLQRLWARAAGEVSWTDVIAQAHVPFYWRVGVAALHAAIVASLLGLAFDDLQASRALRWTPLLVSVVVLPLALAMVAVP
jgi:hypothetical protein